MIWFALIVQSVAIVVLAVKHNKLDRNALKVEDLPYLGSGATTKEQFDADVEKIARRAKMRMIH